MSDQEPPNKLEGSEKPPADESANYDNIEFSDKAARFLEKHEGDLTGTVEPMSKRKKGFPSETHVTTTGDTTKEGEEFVEKLGRNDPCPCGSGHKFKSCHMKDKDSPWQVGDDYER